MNTKAIWSQNEELVSLIQVRYKSFFNTWETIIPFVVIGILLISLYLPFVKLGQSEWKSIMDMKDIFNSILSFLNEKNLMAVSDFAHTVSGDFNNVFWAIFFGSCLIALGRYFIHRSLVILGVVGSFLYIYAFIKAFNLFGKLHSLSQSVDSTETINKVFSSIGEYHTIVGIIVGLCIGFFIVTWLKTIVYCGVKGIHHFFSRKTTKNLEESGSITKRNKRISIIASIISILVFILLYLMAWSAGLVPTSSGGRQIQSGNTNSEDLPY